MDDAAVVGPVPAGASLVVTIDVITPIVDDPRAFGGIAAANALSDVYAMGGKPEVALSFVGFPSDKLPLEVLAEVVQGVAACCGRARCAVVGGHTIADAEPKCGLAVIGTVDPSRAWSHKRARAGDALILTKPIGTGIVGQAIRAGRAEPAMIEAATTQMLALNDVARDVGLLVDASSATDVTGFGLLGHLRHICEAAGLGATVSAGAVPTLVGIVALIEDGVVPGGSRKNLAYAAAVTDFAESIDEATRLVLCDAQTSGGLLLCVPPDRAAEAVRRLVDAGVSSAAVIGALESGAARIHVT